MKCNLSAASPNDIEFTMAITMPLREWRSLAKDMGNTTPGWMLQRQIQEMVEGATKVFHPEEAAS